MRGTEASEARADQGISELARQASSCLGSPSVGLHDALGKSKVGQFQDTRLVEKCILGLDIPVDDAHLMAVANPPQELRRIALQARVKINIFPIGDILQ